MIKKKDYLQARNTVVEYEKQLDLSVVSGSTCYIMHRTEDELVFVVTDKDYVDRLYNSGEYIMIVSKLYNPM